MIATLTIRNGQQIVRSLQLENIRLAYATFCDWCELYCDFIVSITYADRAHAEVAA